LIARQVVRHQIWGEAQGEMPVQVLGLGRLDNVQSVSEQSQIQPVSEVLDSPYQQFARSVLTLISHVKTGALSRSQE
jgi:hypothetical protein